jgi:heterodisulfide reductase subunit A-like polyferredoxin
LTRIDIDKISILKLAASLKDVLTRVIRNKYYLFKMRVPFIGLSIALCFVTKGYSSQATSSPREAYLREILAGSKYPDFPTTPTPSDVPLKVGIIGAGAGGLYTALLLDSLGIDYDILEASDRVGGRIFTHRFNETAWSQSTPNDPDYYDYYVRAVKGK